MADSFHLQPVKLQMLAATQEVRQCNDMTIRFGLSLSDPQIQLLIQRRLDVLKHTGRVEFGEGILPKLIYAFCDSPYLSQANYLETILTLQDSFYYFKNESQDKISDDELIEFMQRIFNEKAQGSLEYLSGTSLEELSKNTRFGFNPDGSTPHRHF